MKNDAKVTAITCQSFLTTVGKFVCQREGLLAKGLVHELSSLQDGLSVRWPVSEWAISEQYS